MTDEQALDIARKGYFEGLQDSVPSLITSNKNRINPVAVTKDSKVNNTTGVIEASVGDNATDFMRIKESLTWVLSGLTNTVTIQGAYYDSQQVYISGFTSYASLTIPSNAIFIRITIIEEDLTTSQLALDTDYIPYQSNEFAPEITLRSNATDFDSLDNYDETSQEWLDNWVYTQRVDESHVTLTTPIVTELPELDQVFSFEDGWLEQIGVLNNEITFSVATNFNAKVDAIGKAVEEIDDRFNLLHRSEATTLLMASWENVLFAPKWSITVLSSQILGSDEVAFIPDNDSELVWFGAQPFIQGVQDDEAGQTILLARNQPSADIDGLLEIKGVVIDG
jgi:hypothetical protein